MRPLHWRMRPLSMRAEFVERHEHERTEALLHIQWAERMAHGTCFKMRKHCTIRGEAGGLYMTDWA